MTKTERKTLEAAEKILIELKHRFQDAAYHDGRDEFAQPAKMAVDSIVAIRAILKLEMV